MSARDDHIGAVFSALSDATRRSVLGQVSRAESITATELAETLPVSRQAVVKHLQVLGRAGLVTSARDGREVRYSFAAAPLAAQPRDAVQPDVIVTNGEAVLKRTPDRAFVTVTVETRAKVPRAAQRANASISASSCAASDRS